VKGNVVEKDPLLYDALMNVGDLVGVSTVEASTLLGVCRKKTRRSAKIMMPGDIEYFNVPAPRGNGACKFVVDSRNAFVMTGTRVRQNFTITDTATYSVDELIADWGRKNQQTIKYEIGQAKVTEKEERTARDWVILKCGREVQDIIAHTKGESVSLRIHIDDESVYVFENLVNMDSTSCFTFDPVTGNKDK